MKTIFRFTFLVCCYFGALQAEAAKKDTVAAENGDFMNQSRLKFSLSGQFWLRQTALNPGSQVNGSYESQVVDFSLRRFRMALSGKVTNKITVKMQLGFNNFNYLSNEIDPRLLDLLLVYKFDDRLYFGAGKNGYTGPSRYASVASSSMLGVDIPIFALSTINIGDDLLRKLGIFIKGDLGRLGYRVVLAKPRRSEIPIRLDGYSDFAAEGTQLQTSGYFKFQLLDRENLGSAYAPGTYHGTKKILNLGFGFLTQDKALWRLAESDTAYHRMNQWAVDVFTDFPTDSQNRRSFTFYGAMFFTDFGPNYLRMIGVNNPAETSDGTSVNGTGNSYPAIGTGQVYFAQIGYRWQLPWLLKGKGGLQPYLSIQYADYERLDEPMRLYESGLNVLFNKHDSKLTFGLQSRPIFFERNEEILDLERKHMIVLQYQFKI